MKQTSERCIFLEKWSWKCLYINKPGEWTHRQELLQLESKRTFFLAEKGVVWTVCQHKVENFEKVSENDREHLQWLSRMNPLPMGSLYSRCITCGYLHIFTREKRKTHRKKSPTKQAVLFCLLCFSWGKHCYSQNTKYKRLYKFFFP